MTPSESDYEKNWGVELCVDASRNPGGILGRSWKTVTVSFAGSIKSSPYLIVHRPGDPDTPTSSDVYSSRVKSDVPVSLDDFSTGWGGSTAPKLSAEDSAVVDKACLLLPSTYTDLTVDNFCVDHITFDN